MKLSPTIWKNERFRADAVVDLENHVITLKFVGALDEKVKLLQVLNYPLGLRSEAKNLLLDLGELSEITSSGVREWLTFMARVQDKFACGFTKVSEVFLERANLCLDMLGKRGTAIAAFDVPYYCGKCDKRITKAYKANAFDPTKGQNEAPKAICEACNGELQFDEVESSYFRFLKHVTAA